MDKLYTKEDMWKVWHRCRSFSIYNEEHLAYEKELFENFLNDGI